MAELSLALLGPFSVVYGERPLTQFRTKAVQALLVYLVCQPENHGREALMTLLWPDLPLKSAQGNLRHTLYHLKQVIPEVNSPPGGTVPFVIADRQSIQVNPAGRFRLDIRQFEALTRSREPEDWELATSLYRGDFLSDFYLPDSFGFETWAQSRRADLRRRLLDTLVRLADRHLERENYRQAEQYVRQQLALDDLREEAHRQLMEVLAKSGRRTDALSHYQMLRQLLEKELGITPSTATENLVEAIRSNSFDDRMPRVALGAETDSILKPLPHFRHNLPTPPTSFIGRETQLMALNDLLLNSKARLVTLLGPGGIGKTRLAIAVAENMIAGRQFPDGVFFVPLAGLTGSDRISSAIAESLQLRLEQGETQLISYLKDRRLLLVLDNFEHLLAGTDLVGRLLAAAPNLQIVTTSRERLRLHGEQLYPIQGLAIDHQAATDDARELFLQAARRIRPAFQATEENLPSLNRICSLVEGMPLALELAAAWVDVLTLSEIAVEIQQNTDFLETDLRDIPRRHHSMRAVFETSWQQLTESEQRLSAQVSIFRGGFTREAVTAVTQASVRDLAQLVNKSLLSYVGENGRYHIHELLRQYNATHLHKESQLFERYCAFYCQWLISQKEALHGPRQAEAVKQIQADMDNIRQVISRRVEQKQFSDLQPTLAVLNDFYIVRGQLHEAIALFEELAQQLDVHPDQAPYVHVWLYIWLSALNGIIFRAAESEERWKGARKLLQNLIFQNRDMQLEEAVIEVQEAYSNFRSDSERAAKLFRASAAVFEEVDDFVSLAQCLSGLGRALRNLGDSAGARSAFSRSLAISQRLGDPLMQLEARLALGFQEISDGHPKKAEKTLENTIAQIRRVNHPERLRMGLRYLYMAQLMNGRFTAASRTTQERRQVEKESGSYKSELLQESLAHALINLHLGQYEEASKIEQVLPQESADQYFMSDAFVVSGLAAIAKGELAIAKEKFQDSQTYYMGPWVCSWIHRYQIGQALVAAMMGEMTTAHHLVHAELQMYAEELRQERRGPVPISFGLAVLSYVVAAQGQSERAVELYELARKNDFIANSHWVADVIGKKITAVSSTLSPQAVATAQSHGRGLDLMETAVLTLDKWTES